MSQDKTDKPRLKNLIGMFLLIFGLTLYAFLAAYGGERMASIWWWLTVPYYILAGILWIWPARALLKWMARENTSNEV